MEVSGRHYAPAALPPKITAVTQSLSGRVGEDKSYSPSRDSNLAFPVGTLYTADYPTLVPIGHFYCLQWDMDFPSLYRDVDKSLARPGRKRPAPVKSAMGRGMD